MYDINCVRTSTARSLDHSLFTMLQAYVLYMDKVWIVKKQDWKHSELPEIVSFWRMLLCDIIVAG